MSVHLICGDYYLITQHSLQQCPTHCLIRRLGPSVVSHYGLQQLHTVNYKIVFV